jgi:hypothetical protein
MRTPNGWRGEQFEASLTQRSVSLGAAWRIVTTPDETLLREVLHDLIFIEDGGYGISWGRL